VTPRKERNWTRPAWKMSAVAVVLSAGVAFATGLTLAPSPAPDALASAALAETIAVATVPFKDSKTVQFTVTQTESRKLIAGLGGTVTSSSCTAGEAVTSGTSTFGVDGVPLINLATATPLWRDLGPGDTGEDVRALQTELTRLGHPTPVTGTLDRSTLDAYARLAATLNAPATGAWVPRDQTIWLPLPTQTVQKCTTPPGSRIAAGQEIADLRAQVTSARIANIPQTAAPGARALIIDGHTFAVTADGRITESSALTDLARLPSFATAEASDTPGTLAAQYELATPARVLGVPPGALFGIEATSACISSRNVTYPVAILGSQLGVTFVTGDKTEGMTEIDLKPGPEARCG
jgi:hypothetical protein